MYPFIVFCLDNFFVCLSHLIFTAGHKTCVNGWPKSVYNQPKNKRQTHTKWCHGHGALARKSRSSWCWYTTSDGCPAMMFWIQKYIHIHAGRVVQTNIISNNRMVSILYIMCNYFSLELFGYFGIFNISTKYHNILCSSHLQERVGGVSIVAAKDQRRRSVWRWPEYGAQTCGTSDQRRCVLWFARHSYSEDERLRWGHWWGGEWWGDHFERRKLPFHRQIRQILLTKIKNTILTRSPIIKTICQLFCTNSPHWNAKKPENGNARSGSLLATSQQIRCCGRTARLLLPIYYIYTKYIKI